MASGGWKEAIKNRVRWRKIDGGDTFGVVYVRPLTLAENLDFDRVGEDSTSTGEHERIMLDTLIARTAKDDKGTPLFNKETDGELLKENWDLVMDLVLAIGVDDIERAKSRGKKEFSKQDRFIHRLALHLGRTVGELLDSLSEEELLDWVRYAAVEPFGPLTDYQRSANEILVHVSKKGIRPHHIYDVLKPSKISVEDMERKLELLANPGNDESAKTKPTKTGGST